jgi:hypothetical protein
MSSEKKYGIVSPENGRLIWMLPFNTIGRAKLAVRNNHFSTDAVAVAEVNEGGAVGPIYAYNRGESTWNNIRPEVSTNG